jgi:hypothetical protein
MKLQTRFILSFLLFFAIGANAQPGSLVGGPQISIDNPLHQFGLMKQGSDISCVFVVKNTGDQPLIISQCRASCGCTTPKCDPTPIAPGASTEIKVSYDSNRLGPFSKSITIFWNSSDGSTNDIVITGDVQP